MSYFESLNMDKSVQVRARVQPQIKQKVELILSRLGLNTSDLKKTINELKKEVKTSKSSKKSFIF